MNHKLTRSELIELVYRIQRAEGTEAELSELLCLLEANVPHPEVSDLIFYATPELTPEQVIDAALAYKPIILPLP